MLLQLAAAAALVLLVPQAQPAEGLRPAPQVALAQPGDEPRRQLRYHPQEGSSETMVLTMTMDMDLSMDGQPLPSGRTPPMRMIMRIDVQDVEEDGDIRYALRLEGAEVLEAEDVPPELAGRLQSSLRSMVGLTGQALVTDRGVTKEADLRLPEGAGPELQQMLAGMRESLTQFGAPLPEEPVGVGARWTVDAQPTSNGLRLDQRMTYTLTDLGDDSATMDVQFTQSAPRQRVTPVGLPPNTTIELESLSGSGSGKLDVSFGRLVPVASSIDGRTQTQMTVTSNGSTQQLSQQIRLEITVRPARAQNAPD